MHIVTVGAFPPYHRGSALFASELRKVLPAIALDWQVGVCAVDPYPLPRGDEVQIVIDRDHQPSYYHAARDIVASGVELAVIQYDRDVYGGPHGAYLLDLTAALLHHGVPYAVTMHAVPEHSSADQRTQLAGLCHDAAAVTTFTTEARAVLCRSGIAPPQRCFVLPRGAPRQLRRPFHIGALRPAVVRALRKLRRTRLLTTLEPARPDRALHEVIAALPTIVDRYPNAALLIAGSPYGSPADRAATAYLHQLRQFASRLGVLERVTILDEYLSTAELSAVLARTDVFVSPHPDPHRDCSGPLAYAIAAGRPVVATATRYATQLFATGDAQAPGVLVPCRDVAALTRAIDDLLGNPGALAAAQAGAAAIGATLVWDSVAARYAGAFRRAVELSPVANAA